MEKLTQPIVDYEDEVCFRNERDVLIDLILQQRITPYFQPIVDLFTGEIFGYEVLSRGIEPFENPSYLFEAAARENLTWELEYSCRIAALKKISSLSPEQQAFHFFINISPAIFSDPRMYSGFDSTTLKDLGISHKNIVIEITEVSSIDDYSTFEELIRFYVEQGFSVALDDFGAGHSGLITLVAMTPHFIKLDRAIISDIHSLSYKQKLVKALSTFSSGVEIKMIAEGIEKYEELKTVFRLGARYGQGFLLGRPASEPLPLTHKSERMLHELIDDYNHTRFAVDISISRMVTRPYTVEVKTITGNDMDTIFRRNNSIDHVVVLKEGKPVQLITRQDFYSAIGGRYGYALYQKRYLEAIRVPEMLLADEKMDVRILGRLAMNRDHKELYNPIVIIDKFGQFIGTVTVKQLLNKAFDMEIRLAACANPLTQLPGNMIIGVWLEEVLRKGVFTLVYGDLNYFKEYNDTYGFARGDDIIRFTAKVMKKYTSILSKKTNLGHIGGDDFIIISEKIINSSLLEELCQEFDTGKEEYFSAVHWESGSYDAMDRKGYKVRVPLVSLSLAVVTSSNFSVSPHPGRLIEIASLLKKKIKATNRDNPRSDFLFERRIYES